MHRRAKEGSFWLAAVIAIAIAVTSAVSLLRQRLAPAPRTAAALHVPIADLRSHAEEARLLARVARDGDLAATFMRQHARQLAQRVQSALVQLPAPEKLLAKAAEARATPPASPRPGSVPRPGAALVPAGAAKPSTAADTPADYIAAANDARRARRAGDTLALGLQRLVDAERPAGQLDVVEPIFTAAARELGFLDIATQEPR